MANKDKRKAFMNKVNEKIDNFGYTVVYTMTETGIPYGYTVGLSANYNQPEVFLVGLDQDLTQGVIHDFAKEVKNGIRFEDGDRSSKVIQDFDVAFIDIPKDIIIENPFAVALEYYSSINQPFKMIQMIIPDPNGKFYWEEGADQHFRKQEDLINQAKVNVQ